MTEKIIYDMGANNGDDIPYYLKKADVVVAIEANPSLCEQLALKYAKEIAGGRLRVENCVLSCDDEPGSVPFYIHKQEHVLSQFPLPPESRLNQYEKVQLPSVSVREIIARHGDPFYIKIDLEHYDAPILRSLFSAKIFPSYLSAESHTTEIFSLLSTEGGYNSFKLVDGFSVSTVYSERIIDNDLTGDREPYSFPYHSAGPFGNDVDGPWFSAVDFLLLLSLSGLGWKDIHVSRIDQPTLDASAQHQKSLVDYLSAHAEILEHPGLRSKMSWYVARHPEVIFEKAIRRSFREFCLSKLRLRGLRILKSGENTFRVP